MKISTIANELNSLSYHGRGIIIGKSVDGKKAITAYFIFNAFKKKAFISKLIGGIAAEAVMVLGYFGYEAVILQYGLAATLAVRSNL